MDSDTLKAAQAPLKQLYRDDPSAGLVTLSARGTTGDGVSCSVETGQALLRAGLHPATGGGTAGMPLNVCSGDMPLQALVACAGVTLSAVATSLGLPVTDARLTAEGDLDFRGTLGVSKEVPVGFTGIRLSVEVEGDLTDEQRATLMKLTERHCVVAQTLKVSPQLTVTSRAA